MISRKEAESVGFSFQFVMNNAKSFHEARHHLHGVYAHTSFTGLLTSLEPIVKMLQKQSPSWISPSTAPQQEEVEYNPPIDYKEVAMENGIHMYNYGYGYVWNKGKKYGYGPKGKGFDKEMDAYKDACESFNLV